MYFSIVFSGRSQYIHDLSIRIAGPIGPFGDTHDSLISGFSTFKCRFRNKYIICQHLVIGQQECKMFLHLQRSDKYLGSLFDNLDHLAFGIVPSALGIDQYPHPVAVHRMHGITLGDEYRLIVIGNHMIFPIDTPFEPTYNLRSPTVRLVFARRNFYQKILLRHAFEQLEYHLFLRCSSSSNPMCDLFVIKRPLPVLVEEFDHRGQHIFFLDSL